MSWLGVSNIKSDGRKKKIKKNRYEGKKEKDKKRKEKIPYNWVEIEV